MPYCEICPKKPPVVSAFSSSHGPFVKYDEVDLVCCKRVLLKKVAHCAWAAPIVAIPKKDGTIRICGDYKVTVNPELDIDQYYPIPRPDDLMATLAGGQKITKPAPSFHMVQLMTNNIPNSQRHQSWPPKLWFSSILQTQHCLIILNAT